MSHVASWMYYCLGCFLVSHYAFVYFSFKDFMYLRGRVTERESEERRETQASPTYWFTPQAAAIIRAVLGRSQEPGASQGSPTWGAEAQALGPTSFTGATAGSWIGRTAAQTQISTHVRCGLAGSGLTLVLFVYLNGCFFLCTCSHCVRSISPCC